MKEMETFSEFLTDLRNTVTPDITNVNSFTPGKLDEG